METRVHRWQTSSIAFIARKMRINSDFYRETVKDLKKTKNNFMLKYKKRQKWSNVRYTYLYYSRSTYQNLFLALLMKYFDWKSTSVFKIDMWRIIV